MMKGQFRKFVDRDDQCQQALCRDVLAMLTLMAGLKCPRNFIRGYLATVKAIIEGEDSVGKKLLQ